MKNLIKVERAKKNWTQTILAEKFGLSRQAINSIETGKFIPSTLLALKMAKVFETNVESVFQLEDTDYSNTKILEERIWLHLFRKSPFCNWESCNTPNSLIDKEKAIISDGLSSVAPQTGLEPVTL